jgi:type VI protein secretion system component VasK
MSQPPTDALVEQLQRANRRWRRLALAALALLVLSLAGWAGTAQMGARRRASELQEQLNQLQEDSDAARRRAEQALYAARIHLAQHALKEAGSQK